jgi:type IX secretion system substrate protein/NHL repeat-containing protein
MKPYARLCLIIALYSCSINVDAQNITVTVVGTSAGGFIGDGESGVSTGLYMPFDVCVDAASNIYFSDSNNKRIRKLSSKNGVISTIAGGGRSMIDGIPATDQSMAVGKITTDATGNLYVIDYGLVRRIDAATNIISTCAGAGGYGYTGDGGPATSAKFRDIEAIGLDAANNIYLLDAGNYCIRKIAAATGIVTTIAGTGVSRYFGDGGPATMASLYSPREISVSLAGDVFFEDVDTGSISTLRKIDIATGNIYRIAGGSGPVYDVPATNTNLTGLSGLCIDRAGNLYFDEDSCTCRKMDMVTDSVYRFGSMWSVESFRDDTDSKYAWMSYPEGLAADGAGNIYIADMGNNRIRKIIRLTHAPTFALGRGQFIHPCTNLFFPINIQMSITDIDFGQPETWTVISSPANGTMSGFPYTRLSNGKDSITLPRGMGYFPHAGFSGVDSFIVQVTDGTTADTVKVYVSVSAAPPEGTISTPAGPDICAFVFNRFSDPIPNGTWSLTDSVMAYLDTGGRVSAYFGGGTDTILYTHPLFRCPVIDTYIFHVITAPTVGAISGADSLCIGALVTLSDPVSGGVWRVSNSNASISGTGVVTGILAGTSVIYYSDSNKCGGATAAKMITIDSFLSVSVITGTDSVCVGASTILSDSVYSGTWSVSNSSALITGFGMINGVSPGIDTVRYSLTNACGVVYSMVAVTVNPLPDVGVITGESAVCEGSTIYLIDTPSGGRWTHTSMIGLITSYGTYTGLSAGTDTVVYSLSNSCGVGYALQTITVVDCIALGNNSFPSAELNIYPNPVSSVLNIEFADRMPKNIIVITDITGREVWRNEYIDVNKVTRIIQANVSDLVPGVYLIKLNNIEVRKFVKQ